MREFDAPDTQSHALIAFDSAIGSSVAVCMNGRVFEASSDDPRTHAEVIGTLITDVLTESSVSPADVMGVVCGVGPGPFTGLRVGIAAAQGFAVGSGAPILPVYSHEAVALEAFIADPLRQHVRIVQDAKRRELFVSDYARDDDSGIPRLVAGPRIEPREGYSSTDTEVWPERIPAGRLLQLAVRRLTAGLEFAAPDALYLRQPDVKAPGPVKRVSS